MTGEPALSVVVASNRHAGLARTVASLAAAAERTGAQVELIVAWQGEGDPPGLPARIVRVLPLGVSAARNAGLVEARAELVAFVDDDETAEPEWAAAVLRAFADARVDAAFGQVLPADTEGVPYCELRIDAPRLLRGRRRAPWDIGTGGNMAFRRGALLALNGFDVRIGGGTPTRAGEDTDIIARLQEAGAVIARWPDMVVRHPTKPAAEVRASRRPYGRGMGVLARRRLSPVLVWNFFSAAVWEAYRVLRARDPARAGELADTLLGWTGGILAADAWDAPAAVVARAPAEIAAALRGRPVRGLPVARRGDVHLVYQAEDVVLHVRTGDPEPLVRAAAVQRALAGRGDVPRVRAAVHDGLAQWVVEDRLALRPLPREALPEAVAALARPGAGRVRDGDWWTRARRTLPAAVPDAWAPLVREAVERVGDLPAGPAHGDPSADNIFRCASQGIAVLGWEAAEPDAPVGIDALALSTRIRQDGVDELLARRGPVPGALAGLGVAREAVPWLLTVTLAHLAAREARRATALGAPPRPLADRPLFDRLAPRLAAACR